MRRNYAIFVLMIVFVAIVLMNVFCLPTCDEMTYRYFGISTPIDDPCWPMRTLADIIYQQWFEYRYAGWSGRMPLNGLIALFCTYKLWYLVDFLNSIMYFLLTWLILREGGLSRLNVQAYFKGFCILYIFLWSSQCCCQDAAFAINYLWMGCFTVFIMWLWRHFKSFAWLPVFFAFGWSNEGFCLPWICATAGACLVRSVAARRVCCTLRQAVALGCVVMGAMPLVFCPSALQRAAGSVDGKSAITVLANFARPWLGMVVQVWPVVLLFLVLVLALRKMRNRVGVLRSPELEWWFFFMAGLSMFSLVGIHGMIRLAFPFTIAGVILLVRNRAYYQSFYHKISSWVCFSAAGWIVLAACFQVVIGSRLMTALSEYQDNPQGVACLEPTSVGLFWKTCYQPFLCRMHRSVYRREYGKRMNPVFLTKVIYNNLYQDASAFQHLTKPLGETGFRYFEELPSVLIRQGVDHLSPEQVNAASNHLVSIRPRIKWHEHLFPGLKRKMFPDERCALGLPADMFPLKSKDGQTFVLYYLSGDDYHADFHLPNSYYERYKKLGYVVPADKEDVN